MNLPTCENFCTTDKCLELEEKITNLQYQLNELTSLVNEHINQAIPTAHEYTPKESNLSLSGSFQSEILTLTVADGESQDSTQITIPSNKSNLSLTGSFQSEILTLTIDDGNSQDSTEITIPSNKSNLSLNGSFESEILTLTVADGESQDSTQITIPLPEIPEYRESNLSLSGSFQSEILTLTVADGESQDSTQITIPLSDNVDSESCNLSINGSYLNEIITITYSDCNGTNSFEIPIPIGNEIINITNNNHYGGGGGNLECPNIETKIEECCEQILDAINSLQINVTNEINDTETIIINDVSEVKDAVCFDITGSINGDYTCQWYEDKDGNIIPYYAYSSGKELSYNNKGFAGIHELLRLLSMNLDIIHNDVCKAVDPLQKITLEDMYNFCDDSGIKREDFSDDKEGETDYNEALNRYFLELQKESKYGYLITDTEDINKPGSLIDLIEAPTNWTNYILTDFALIQSRINRNIICNLEIPEMPDVVTIVATEKDAHRVKTKSLVLHFVTLDAYPKRRANQGYRPTQIPAAKESYDWLTDFNDLRWTQGNQFAELRFVEPYVPVSGWFADVDAANAYFDAVLSLTTATEDNRVFTEHSNPKTDYSVRVTRPYRAFIVSVNEKRERLCHAKYVPVIEVE